MRVLYVEERCFAYVYVCSTIYAAQSTAMKKYAGVRVMKISIENVSDLLDCEENVIMVPTNCMSSQNCMNVLHFEAELN